MILGHRAVEILWNSSFSSEYFFCLQGTSIALVEFGHTFILARKNIALRCGGGKGWFIRMGGFTRDFFLFLRVQMLLWILLPPKKNKKKEKHKKNTHHPSIPALTLEASIFLRMLKLSEVLVHAGQRARGKSAWILSNGVLQRAV